MADTRAYSPNFQGVAALADRALARPEGITINFEVATYGSIEACAHVARGFQKTFTSLRARARRLSERQLGGGGLTGVRGGCIVGGNTGANTMKGYLSPREGGKNHRDGVLYDVASEINPIKSRLLDQLSKVEQANAAQAANALGRIIGELEAWQARYG